MQNTFAAPVTRPPPSGPVGRPRPTGQSVIAFPANDHAAGKIIWVDDRFAQQRSIRDRTAREALRQRSGRRIGPETARANDADRLAAAAFIASPRSPAKHRPIAPFLAQHIAQERINFATGSANSYANASAAYAQTFERDRTILGPQVQVSYRL